MWVDSLKKAGPDECPGLLDGMSAMIRNRIQLDTFTRRKPLEGVPLEPSRLKVRYS